MRTMHAVSNAIHLAEVLADEADDIGLDRLSRRLRRRAHRLSLALEAALSSNEEITRARGARQTAYAQLSSLHASSTHDLRGLLPASEPALCSQGPHLDVAERVRFRIRRLQTLQAPLTIDVLSELTAAIASYEQTVDTYLEVSARAQTCADEAIQLSQVVRRYLERAKAHLLARSHPESAIHDRIRRRRVRTKKATWLHGEMVQQALEALADEDTLTSPLGGRIARTVGPAVAIAGPSEAYPS